MQNKFTENVLTLAENLVNPKVTPIKDQVVVRQDAPKERLASGLYLPDTLSRELQEDFGTVLAVGPGAIAPGGARIPIDVRPGDRVLFQRRPESALVPDEREGGRPEWLGILMLRASDILAVIED